MSLFSSPKVGATAPALELPTADGAGLRALVDLRGRPVMVSFLGPAHCGFCRAHVIRSIQHHDDFKRLGAEVVFVAYHDPEELMAKMLRDLDLPYTLLLDPTRATYRQWGLDQATWRHHLVPGLYLAVLQAILRRERRMEDSPGPVQIGGDFVIDRQGRLRFVHVMKSFHDRARMPELLSALETA